MQEAWPDLPTSGFIRGRAATEADIKAGNAVFLTMQGGAPDGRPLRIEVPPYAYWRDEDGRRLPVVVVQAEANATGETLGLRDASGAEYLATRPEVTPLGRRKPGA